MDAKEIARLLMADLVVGLTRDDKQKLDCWLNDPTSIRMREVYVHFENICAKALAPLKYGRELETSFWTYVEWKMGRLN